MKNDVPRSYTALWIIVIVLLIFVGVTHVVYRIWTGRWECTDYKYVCETCEVEGSGIIKIENQELEYTWKMPNENMCRCTDIRKECKTKVWTWHPDNGDSD